MLRRYIKHIVMHLKIEIYINSLKMLTILHPFCLFFSLLLMLHINFSVLLLLKTKTLSDSVCLLLSINLQELRFVTNFVL